MKKISTYLTIGLTSFLLFSGCTLFDPDLKIARQLEGEWEVTSFTVDGVESMQALFSRFVMEYEKYNDGEGDFNFTLNNIAGGTDNFFGEYVVDEDGTNLELTYDNGAVENWDLDLEKDNLDMTSVIDGSNYRITAERN